jgi:hypothetical protein
MPRWMLYIEILNNEGEVMHKIAPSIKIKKYITIAVLLILTKNACAVVTTDPGDYIPLPEDTSIAMFYGQYADRDALRKDGKDVNTNFKLKSDIYLARFGYYSELNGHPVTVQTIIPYGELSLTSPGSQKSTGIGDVILMGSIWFYDGIMDTNYYAIGSFVTLPTGKYKSDNAAINIGSNRVSTGLQWAWNREIYNQLWSELTLEGAIYTDNNDYAGEKLKQDPTAEAQLHFRYNVSDSMRLAVSYFNTLGGKQTSSGIEQQGSMNNNRVLFTVGGFIYPTVDAQLQAGRDIFVKNGPEEDLRLQFRLSTFF